ncbi:MAG: acyl-CoA dehydratase activase-related protein [Bacillota bacterium]|nr:acyl-CoA dehydratase activase-related protein [Bacillota bacterium]
MRVGIPQALLFWTYAPLWFTLLKDLGVEPFVSRATTRATLDAGVKLAVEEACLPVKVFFGHCAELAASAEAVFVPRLVSVEPRAYICPKFMGLPDMAGRALGRQVPLLTPLVDLRRGAGGLSAAAAEVAGALGIRRRRAEQALACGLAVQRAVEARWGRGCLPPVALAELGLLPAAGGGDRGPVPGAARRRGRLGVLGHPYNVYDRQVSLDLLARLLAAGWSVETAETIPADECEAGARELPKELFWTMGRRVYGAAAYLMSSGAVEGLIYLASFGCGPDSLVGELVARLAERRGVPFLLLTLDEHTGEAGVWTRVEAFLDLIERREARAPRPG